MVKGLCFEDTGLDGEVHFLKSMDPYIARVLCFPRDQCSDLHVKTSTLINDGFVYLLETGVDVHGLRLLGRGYTAVVTIAYHSKLGLGSLKLLRVDSRRSSLIREAEFMKQAEPTGLPPRVYLYRDSYVFYELLPPHECRSFTTVLNELVSSGKVNELKELLLSTLKSLHHLDCLGIDHSEINRPGGHVFYCNGLIKVIDWESSRLSRKPVNLTSFTSFLLYRYKYASKLRELLKFDLDKVIKALRRYKTSYSLDSFNEIIETMFSRL
jgi:putative serine/threonine protein kinase